MAAEKWKLVLSQYPLVVLFQYTHDQLISQLSRIKGVGPGIISSIWQGFQDFKKDVEQVLYMPNIVESYGAARKPKVSVTGFRAESVIKSLKEKGYDCSDSYGVTKDTAFLIALDPNASSIKIQKARKYGIKIVALDDYLSGKWKP